MSDPLALFLLLFILLPIGDVAATIFFAALFWRSKRPREPGEVGVQRQFMSRLLGDRSWLLALLTASFATITCVFLLIGSLAFRRLLGFEPLAQGAILTAAGLFVLGTIPIAFMLAFVATRRRGGDHAS